MDLATYSELLLTKEQLKKILNEIPFGNVKPTDPLPANIILPPFKKLGVLIDHDEDTEAKLIKAESSTKNKNVNKNTSQSQAYSCIQCRRCLPTAHLLDLHITEQHDLYFAASVDRGDRPMYGCYIEECTMKFQTPGQRKNHCITLHKFPSNYRFDQVKLSNQVKGRKQRGDDLMEVESETPSNEAQLPYIKAFSFGHHNQRTFDSRKERGSSGKTPLNMQEMKETLEEMD